MDFMDSSELVNRTGSVTYWHMREYINSKNSASSRQHCRLQSNHLTKPHFAISMIDPRHNDYVKLG